MDAYRTYAGDAVVVCTFEELCSLGTQAEYPWTQFDYLHHPPIFSPEHSSTMNMQNGTQLDFSPYLERIAISVSYTHLTLPTIYSV